MAEISFSGGDRLDKYLSDIARKLNDTSGLKVGFLGDATYPDGTSVAYIAGVQEFGGTINHKARTTTIYRKIAKDGTFLRNGRFVKRKSSNFATTHSVPAYTVRIPARPFFRRMIKEKSPKWGEQFAKILKSQKFNVKTSYLLMGHMIADQLRESINSLTSPALAPSTVRAKGFAKPLIDTSVMLNTVDYEVGE